MVFEMESALISATLARLVLMATVVAAPATFILPSTSKSTPELSLKVAGANGEPTGHWGGKVRKKIKLIETYRGELDLVVGLQGVAKLEGGGVLATAGLIDLDLGTSEKVILF